MYRSHDTTNNHTSLLRSQICNFPFPTLITQCVKIQLYHKKSEHNLLSVARLFHQGCSVDMFRWICFKKHDSGCIFRMIYIDKPFKYTLPCPDMILLGPRWRAWQLQPGVTIVPPTLATRSGASEAFCMFTLYVFQPYLYCLCFPGFMVTGNHGIEISNKSSWKCYGFGCEAPQNNKNPIKHLLPWHARFASKQERRCLVLHLWHSLPRSYHSWHRHLAIAHYRYCRHTAHGTAHHNARYKQ